MKTRLLLLLALLAAFTSSQAHAEDPPYKITADSAKTIDSRPLLGDTAKVSLVPGQGVLAFTDFKALSSANSFEVTPLNLSLHDLSATIKGGCPTDPIAPDFNPNGSGTIMISSMDVIGSIDSFGNIIFEMSPNATFEMTPEHSVRLVLKTDPTK